MGAAVLNLTFLFNNIYDRPSFRTKNTKKAKQYVKIKKRQEQYTVYIFVPSPSLILPFEEMLYVSFFKMFVGRKHAL